MAIRSSFSIFLEKLEKRREFKGGKGHLIEVRRSCTRRTTMCTRINKNKTEILVFLYLLRFDFFKGCT